MHCNTEFHIFCSFCIVEKKQTRQRWPDAKTLKLIQVYSDYHTKVGKSQELSKFGKMWRKICELLNADGEELQFTWKQVQNRFTSLEKSYKDIVDNARQSGRGRNTSNSAWFPCTEQLIFESQSRIRQTWKDVSKIYQNIDLSK